MAVRVYWGGGGKPLNNEQDKAPPRMLQGFRRIEELPGPHPSRNLQEVEEASPICCRHRHQ